MSIAQITGSSPAMLKKLEAEVRLVFSIAVQDFGFDADAAETIITSRGYAITSKTTESKEDKKERVALEKAAEKERIKQEKLAEKERIKQEKIAEKERLKQEKIAEKEAAKELAKKEKEAAKELAKKEKEAAKELAKKEKETAKKEKETARDIVKEENEASKAKIINEIKQDDNAEEEEEEEDYDDEVEVSKFEHKGVIYLRDEEGMLYDKDTQEPVGTIHPETGELDRTTLDNDEE